jgi:hypothetical protein
VAGSLVAVAAAAWRQRGVAAPQAKQSAIFAVDCCV